MFWSLRTDRQGLPEKFFNLSFNIIFYIALTDHLPVSHCYWVQTVQKYQEAVSFSKFLFIPLVPVVFYIRHFLINFA